MDGPGHLHLLHDVRPTGGLGVGSDEELTHSHIFSAKRIGVKVFFFSMEQSNFNGNFKN